MKELDFINRTILGHIEDMKELDTKIDETRSAGMEAHYKGKLVIHYRAAREFNHLLYLLGAPEQPIPHPKYLEKV